MSGTRQYTDFFNDVRDTLYARSCDVMNAQRTGALDRFRSLGFPTRRTERYKYTDAGLDFEPDYGIALTPLTQELPKYCYRICNAPVDVTPYYNSIADKQDAVVCLNTMLSVDALLVYIPRNTRPEHPIQISNILKGDNDTMVNRRLLIILEEGAEADIIITDHAVNDSRFLTNQVIEAFAGENSHLNIYEIEETHLLCTRYSNFYIHESRNASVRHTSLSLFNGHTRNTCTVHLAGEGSEVNLNGCVIADKMQHVDNNTRIEHLVPHCTSDELYKYVLDDSAVGAFAGIVYVREGAQKTSSAMTNANLCATDSARMYTQPMLEIYADDVKCSHGSTVGQLGEDALFYMMQRGIGIDEARLLLKSAFITEVIETIPLEPLRDRLHFQVDKRLRGELSKCEGCKLCK